MNDLCDNDRLAGALNKRLVESGKLVEARLNAALATVGLSLPKLAAITQLAEAPVPLGQLAGCLACVKSNMSQLIDRLESDGLVRRCIDPSDRRVVCAELTAEGQRRLVAGLAVMEQAETAVLHSYTAEEQRLLLDLLRRLE